MLPRFLMLFVLSLKIFYRSFQSAENQRDFHMLGCGCKDSHLKLYKKCVIIKYYYLSVTGSGADRQVIYMYK